MSRIIIKHIENRITIDTSSIVEEVIVYRDILGQIHREDGPALIWPNGEERWYFNGEYLKDVHSVEDLIIKRILE